MAAYCKERKLPLNQIGKILVPVNTEDAPMLDLLEDRAQKNGVLVHRLDNKALIKEEPEARSASGEALFVPGTSIADSSAVMKSILSDCLTAGVEVKCSSRISLIDVPQKKIKLSLTLSISLSSASRCRRAAPDRSRYLDPKKNI
jgi:L-2-hydroxyglutarate oxidase LhgO